MAGAEIFNSDEIRAVADVIERKMIHRYGSHDSRGGIYRAEDFEEKAKRLTGSKCALALSSGTAALITALKGICIKPGDEVITSPFTFIATVEAIVACDAVPVFAQHAGEPWNRDLMEVLKTFGETGKPMIGHCAAGMMFGFAGVAAGRRVRRR